MGFFDKFNGTGTVRKEIGDIKDWPFMPLKDYEGTAIPVDGFFFTEGKYGPQVVLVGNGAKINMPAYALKIFKKIAADDEAVERMLAGEMAVTDIAPMKTKNGETVGFRICDASEVEVVPEEETPEGE